MSQPMQAVGHSASSNTSPVSHNSNSPKRRRSSDMTDDEQDMLPVNQPGSYVARFSNTQELNQWRQSIIQQMQHQRQLNLRPPTPPPASPGMPNIGNLVLGSNYAHHWEALLRQSEELRDIAARMGAPLTEHGRLHLLSRAKKLIDRLAPSLRGQVHL